VKIALSLVYFALYGITWPYYVGGRTRGGLMLLCIVMPYLAFWFGWFCK